MKTLSHDNIFKISDFPIPCSRAVCHLGIIIIIYIWKSIYYQIYGIICPCFVTRFFRWLYQSLTKPIFAPVSPITMCIKHNLTFSLQTVFFLLFQFQFSDFSLFLFFYMFFVDKLFKSQSIEESQVGYCSWACDRKVRDLEHIIVREGFHCSWKLDGQVFSN